MDEPQHDHLSRGQLFEEASVWFSRMRGPRAEKHRPAFEAWLKRGALHRANYNLVVEIFLGGDALADEPAPKPNEAVPATVSKTRWPLVLAVGAALGTVALSWTALRPAGIVTDPDSSDAVRGTEVAQWAPGSKSRDLRLVDGSLVRLSADARLDVVYDGALRRLTLEHGEANFRVAHEARPFVVYAGGGSVTAHGTIFDVSLSNDHHVSVKLIEGSIAVALPSSKDGGQSALVRQMHRGQTMKFSAVTNLAAMQRNLVAARPQAATPPAATAHDYDQIRLSDLIADANNNSPRPIRIADPSLGDLRLSGWFSIGDPDQLADRIGTLFGLAVDRRDPSTIVIKRK